MYSLDLCLARLVNEPGVLVRVEATRGSAPRGRGAWMFVWNDDLIGTIGGGHLEFDATTRARELLRSEKSICTTPLQEYILGPHLGQCCGGRVSVSFRCVTAQDAAAVRRELVQNCQPIALFGAGHIGTALVRVLARLPFEIHWLDSREGIFPSDLSVPLQVKAEHVLPPHDAVADIAAGSKVLVMTHSHAEDFEIVHACLKRRRHRSDLTFLGLIGSKTKFATFRNRLNARGFTDDEIAGVTCPIGISGISGKDPESIAIAIAAQLLRLSNFP